MRRLLCAAAIAAIVASVLAIAPASPAAAHPLGNFTINTSTAVVVRPDAIVVDRVVDMAEIPAFRERRTIDADLDGRVSASEATTYRRSTCERLAAELVVRVDGRQVPLVAIDDGTLSFPPGAGGLSTLRLACRAATNVTPTDDASVTIVDRAYPDAIGWREIAAVGDRVTLVAADVPIESPSANLTDYPSDELPPDVRRASLRVRPGGPPLAGGLPPLDGSAAADTRPGSVDAGPLASLVGTDDLTLPLLLTMLGLALGIGALHALGPGHGKTLIGAYLVGAGGTLRHVVAVGAAVSLMHTASVLALGLLVLSAERLFAPERVYPILGLTSGLIALALGTSLLVARVRERGRGHDHAHPHPHDLDRPDRGTTPLSRRGLAALAVSGGVLPSPSALVTLLAAVSLGRTALGLALIVAFSIGLATSLTGVGIVTLHARDLARRRFAHRAARVLPIASAAAIAATGVFLTVQGALRL